MSRLSDDRQPGAADEFDFEMARRALLQNWPTLTEESPKFSEMLDGLADFHRYVGTDRFELRYNLRPPKDRGEAWAQECMRGAITKKEYRARLKADAERPIDLEMLTTFYDAYQQRLQHYSGVLQNAVIQSSEVGTSRWRRNEKAIDEHVAALQRKLPLWWQNSETVFDFLDELQVTSGNGLINVGEFEATSAHWLALLVFTSTTDAWQSCRTISDRSHQDDRYEYAARAIDLFSEVWLPKLPPAQRIYERLRAEFILAKVKLKQMAHGGQPSSNNQSVRAIAAALDSSIDNECREHLLIGEFWAVIARAGHIFRPGITSDYGIDGEVEFKDSAGQASGHRVYVQLKSGDSYLTLRKADQAEVFTCKKDRHLQYWSNQAYPVMLVIRQSSGSIRWMDVREYLRMNGTADRRIIFRGETVNVDSVRRLGESLLTSTENR